MDRVRRRMAIVLAVMFLYGSTPGFESLLFGAGPGDEVTYSQVATVPSQELSGKVMYPDGKMVEAGVKVKVINVEQNKTVYETSTVGKGAYKIPKLPPGRYAIVFGDKVRVNLLVVEGAEPPLKFFNVMIPRGAMAAFPLLDAAIIGMLGGALAVGLVAAAGGFGGGGGGGGAGPAPIPPQPVVSP